MNPYDEIPYPSYVHQQTHPSGLAAIATLLGMQPAPVERCRVLELGCGTASNLIPMAFGLPDSGFVGVDLAAIPVRTGQSNAEALGLKNLTLRQASVLDLNSDLGEFDYIIAHGLFSWVPAEVRDAILALCRRHLRPHGVAYVSFNALPGGHLRLMLREMLRFRVRNFSTARDQSREALALLRMLAGSMPKQPDRYRALLREELEQTLKLGEAQLFHELLAPVNQPFYFHEFMEHAAQHRLQYLAEAAYFEMPGSAFTEDISETLATLGGDRIGREQYWDFLRCRRFRQTLLCHDEVKLNLSPAPEVVEQFYLASSVRPKRKSLNLVALVEEDFVGARGLEMSIDLPLAKAALCVLGDVWPDLLKFSDLVSRADARLAEKSKRAPARPDELCALREIMVQAHACGFVEFHARRPAMTVNVGERPTASALARWQIERGPNVTTLLHADVEMADEVGRQLIRLLDGSRDRAGLRREMDEWLQRWPATHPGDSTIAKQAGKLRANLNRDLEDNLHKLARLALLVA